MSFLRFILLPLIACSILGAEPLAPSNPVEIARDPFIFRFHPTDQHKELFDTRASAEARTNIANQLPGKSLELLKALSAEFPNVSTNFVPRARNLGSKNAPAWVQRPNADGAILLHARDVEIHGSMVRYEPQTNKNTIGYWTKVDDWVSWDFLVTTPGEYEVTILQGCGPRSGGSVVEFSANNQKLSATVQETKHFQDFIERNIGTLKFEEAGRYTFSVKPQSKPGGAVMDLRLVTLTPKKSAR